jgi:O-antigen/teichoic acid export membrane protein
MFASFSIAALIGPLVHLFRQSINFTFLPSMSRGQAAGDVLGMLELNGRANVMAAALLCPLLAFVFVFAEEIVTIVYTGVYVDAAPIMRVYIVGLAALVIELASVTFLLRQGPFVMGVNLVALGLSLPFNWFSAQHFGPAGAAVGSVIALYLDRLVTLRRVALLTGAPFRRLQDWRALGQLILFSALAAAVAWGMVGRYFAAGGPLIRASVGVALLAAAYGTMHGLFGMGRSGLLAARNPEHGL